MLRFLTAGESHGKGLVVILEGIPAGLSLSHDYLQKELSRRRLGYGRGPRQRFEKDVIELRSGFRHGRTLGSPISILIENAEWPKWEQEMSPHAGETQKPLHQPRPGHADLAGMQKYGLRDARDILERASARETAARVAAGACAKALLRELGTELISHVIQMGNAHTTSPLLPMPGDRARIDASEVRCTDPVAEEEMIKEIKAAAKVGDSLGGVAEVLAYDVPIGLGSHIQWDRKIDGLLAQALMSIQAVKAVEIGEAIAVSSARGSAGHDGIAWDDDARAYQRDTSLAGGIEGGITNGSVLRARAYMKPLATLSRPTLPTIDIVTKEPSVSFRERTDVTAVPAMGVIAESMTALVLAQEALRKFGGDHVDEFKRNYTSYCAALQDGIGG